MKAVLSMEPEGLVMNLPLKGAGKYAPLIDGKTGGPVIFNKNDLLKMSARFNCELSQVASSLGVQKMYVKR